MTFTNSCTLENNCETKLCFTLNQSIISRNAQIQTMYWSKFVTI